MVPRNSAASTVLVVEDQQGMRQLICRMLERSHFAVFDCGNARQALGLLDGHPEIELAIIDMVMPGMSGLDLAAEMSRRHPGIQILYISGFVASIAIQAIADQRPEAVLLKPFTEQQLMQRVRRLLSDAGDPPIALTLESAWARLIEGSDQVSNPCRIAAYCNTLAAYSIAAAHVAVLRQAGLPYQFAPSGDAAHPIQLLANAGQRQKARDAISMLGLSADIAIAA